MRNTREIGDSGELFAKSCLERKGYTVRVFDHNHKTYDLEVHGRHGPFNVSVKTSQSKQHVRLGPSRDSLEAGHFVIAIMPLSDEMPLQLVDGKCRMFIIPAEKAKQDGKYVHDAYFKRNPGNSESMGTIVKGYAKSAEQREVWERWKREYTDAWLLLPPPV